MPRPISGRGFVVKGGRMKRVQPAVTVAGPRFRPGPHQYVIKGGDGTRYDTREKALEAYDRAEREMQ